MSIYLRKKHQEFCHMASRSFRKIWKTKGSTIDDDGKGRVKYKVFEGSTENFIENGALALEESISLFHGRTNPIRYFSVDELNEMNLEPHPMSFKELDVNWYKGFWDGSHIMAKEQTEKLFTELRIGTFREIFVAAQMSTHNNVHKLIGCCLETKHTILVFEWVENVTLHDLLLFRDDKSSLGWNKRLRIAWEISHALSYLHTGFHRPIMHRSLKPHNLYFGKNNAAKLSDFSLSISVPEGKEYVEDIVVGTSGYLAPEYANSNRVAESVDVYAFGVFFLVLLTGKDAVLQPAGENGDEVTHVSDWVMEGLQRNCISEVVDPEITKNILAANEEIMQQLRASIDIALRCAATEKDARPTMVEVATELKSMIRASESLLVSNGL